MFKKQVCRSDQSWLEAVEVEASHDQACECFETVLEEFLRQLNV